MRQSVPEFEIMQYNIKNKCEIVIFSKKSFKKHNNTEKYYYWQ